MKIIYGLCVCAFLGALLVFGVDFVFYLKSRYCRFHIGRLNDASWRAKVTSTALKWMERTPTVKRTDNSRYLLLDMISGNYRDHSIQSWQTAALILGVKEKNITSDSCIDKYIDENGDWKNRPQNVDVAMLSYAILKTTDNSQKIKPAMDQMLEVINNNTDKEGLVRYTNIAEDTCRYVDTIGLVCPFLTYYSRVYSKPEYESLAFRQIQFFHDNGLLKDTCLPNHAIDTNMMLPLGVYGWGRGTAWYVIGLLDSYSEMIDVERKKILAQWIIEAAEAYKTFQKQDGGFGSILQRKMSYDSSATAVLSYFYYKCGMLFNNDEYIEIAESAMKKLKSVTRISGAIDWCQGDTKDIGVFSQTYDVMPFAQGFTLRAIALQERLNK